MKRTVLSELSAKLRCLGCPRGTKGKMQALYDHETDEVVITTDPTKCECGQPLTPGLSRVSNYQMKLERLILAARSKMIELGLLAGTGN